MYSAHAVSIEAMDYIRSLASRSLLQVLGGETYWELLEKGQGQRHGKGEVTRSAEVGALQGRGWEAAQQD